MLHVEMFESAKLIKAELNAALDSASAALNAYPKGDMGLTPDSVKATKQWKADYKAFNAALSNLRNFNSWFSKYFKLEIRAAYMTRFDTLREKSE